MERHPTERDVLCPYCKDGWPMMPAHSKRGYTPKHLYPSGWKGQRAGLGPYCLNPREEQ